MPRAVHPPSSGDANEHAQSEVVPFPRFPKQEEAEQHPSHHNLSLELTSFVGRQRQIAQVKEMLLVDYRLLTLTGPGGCGKTRLALKVASDMVQELKDGVWFVELASLSDPDLVPQAVAQALGVREAQHRTLTQTLCDHFGSKKMLLMLDNCEHLVEECGLIADALLRACPALRILATSREALGIAGERTWLVPSLSLPDPQELPPFEQLARYEAVQLFVERAAAAASAFELTERNAPAVAGLCRRLDGMPLAIELAAARVRVLSVEQIASRLEDCFALLTGGSRAALPRQRTLVATIEWSYELLSQKERVLFRRLSVFLGGFTLEAAEEVCAGEDIQRKEGLDLLSLLADKSLVLVAGHKSGEEEARYRLLETVRQYGKERLEESGEAEPVRKRHARYYLRLAEEAEPESREQGAWLERLGTEQANLRAALGWALDPEAAQEPAGGHAGLGLRLAAALAQGRFWAAYGPSEGLGWLERALASTSSSTSSKPARAKALNEAGYILTWRGEYERGVALLEESLALFKELGDESGVTASFFQLALTVLHRGDHERVGALREEAEAMRRELTDRRAISHLLHFLAMAALDGYDYERAVALFEESLVLFRELGDLRSTAMCLTGLGMTALEREDHERAAVLFEEDLRVLLELRDKVAIVYGLLGVAGVASQRGGAARAARLWGAAEALEEANSFSMSPFVRAHYDYEGYLAAARSQLDEEKWQAAWAEGKAMAPEQAIEYALEPSPATTRPRPENIAALSAREVEVLTLVAEGLTDSQVADMLYLSPRTVGQHLRSIYNKLGASSRTAAVKEAVGRGLI